MSDQPTPPEEQKLLRAIPKRPSGTGSRTSTPCALVVWTLFARMVWPVVYTILYCGWRW